MNVLLSNGLKGLNVLIVEKMDGTTGKEFSTFEPLLNNLPELYPDLMCK